MNKFINIKKSELINKFHSFIVLYILFGWLIENQRGFLLFFIPSVQFQFLVNNNTCILTQLENKLLELESDKKEDNKNELNNSFVDKKMKELGIRLSPKIREYLVYSSGYISFLITYAMYVN